MVKLRLRRTADGMTKMPITQQQFDTFIPHSTEWRELLAVLRAIGFRHFRMGYSVVNGVKLPYGYMSME